MLIFSVASSSTGKRFQYDPKDSAEHQAGGSYKKHQGTLPKFVDTRNMTDDHFADVKTAMKTGQSMKQVIHSKKRQASNQTNRWEYVSPYKYIHGT